MEEQIKVKTVLMRGGSSKAVFLDARDVPNDEAALSRFLLAIFGSPDKRQIDGLGGSDYLTSKCAIMGPPTRPDADIDYNFVQVAVESPIVSYDINCGNISSAAGVYAIEEGYVKPQGEMTIVRVHNTNTGKILRMKIPTKGGRPQVEGDFAIDGVPGTGAEIAMDFSATAGAASGRLLPTGNVKDRIELETIGKSVDVSIVDVANMCVFVAGESMGMTGAERPNTVPVKLLDALEELRGKAYARCGINAPSYLLPFQVVVGGPQEYENFLHPEPVPADSMDVTARLYVDRTMHKAYAGTGATCLAVAAQIPGTVVNEVARKERQGNQVRIGHPSGTLPIVANVSPAADGWKVDEVLFSRTARRLMEGQAYIRRARL